MSKIDVGKEIDFVGKAAFILIIFCFNVYYTNPIIIPPSPSSIGLGP